MTRTATKPKSRGVNTSITAFSHSLDRRGMTASRLLLTDCVAKVESCRATNFREISETGSNLRFV
jgi:hypothetical protein